MSLIGRWVLVVSALAAVGLSLGSESSATQRARTQTSSTNKGDDSEGLALELRREGTKLINVVGRFENEGDAAVFVTKDGLEFGGLPNLSLERIITTLKSVDDPNNVWWNINGMVTEFSGRNYVLVTRAVFKATSPPPPPQARSLAK